MAGRGSRFSEAGYKLPKPLIDVNGMPMIELVIKNLTPRTFEPRFILICQSNILKSESFNSLLESINCEYKIIPIDYITNGAAETVLLARDYIDNDNHLMIANCDQFVDINIDHYLNHAFKYDACIMTMKANHPKWSYIKYKNNKIVDVVEKEVVSDDATVGIYNYSSGRLFVHSADEMISKNIRVNNEFYVAPVYKEIIELGMSISTYDISGNMYGLGTPEDLESFINTESLQYYHLDS